MTSIDLASRPFGADMASSIGGVRAALARWRVVASYGWRHRRLPDLDAPIRFTELVQIRKLYDRSAEQTSLMDKVAAKGIAEAALGTDWVVPTIWSGNILPDAIPFAVPAILKARHGCNQNAVLCEAPATAQWRRLQHRSQRWQRSPYGIWLDEWAYRDVPRGLIAEPLLGGRLPLPIDYKIYVFGGRATHVQVHLGRGGRHRWILHDRNWRPLVDATDRPAAPESLPAMLAAAETLSRGMSFLRVDLYEVDGHPYFGEFCLYPGSGFDPFAADWIDHELGALWLDAMPS
jgi:hypothetical protein